MTFSRVALFVTAAMAMGLPAVGQAADPFVGPRVEADGGWDRVQGDHRHHDGFLYGGALGYDIASNKVRFGPELEITGATGRACEDGPLVRDCVKAGRDIYIGGRLGVVVNPKLLVYGKLGYTNARFTDDVHEAGILRYSDSDDRSGFRVGAGGEYALSPRFFVKTEYRYSRYSGHMARNQLIGGAGLRF